MLADLIFTDVPGRVAKALLQLARQFGSQESGLLRVTHDLTQEEIAQLVGASPGDGEQGARRLRAPRLAAAGGQERADPGAGAAGPPRSLTLGAEKYLVRPVPECATLDGVSSTSSLPHAESASLVRLPRRADRSRCAGPGAVLRARPAADRDVRAGDAALRAAGDRLVRRGRAGLRRRAVGCLARLGRPGPADRPARPDPPAAGRRGAVRGGRGRADHRGRDGPRRWPLLVGAGAVAGAVQPALPGCVPRAVGPAGAARAAARRRLHLRGDQPGGLLHPRPGVRGVPGRGAVAGHRPGGGRGGDGRRRASGSRSAAPVRASEAGRCAAGPLGLLGALAGPAMRTVALASLGFGLVVGAVEVGVPAVDRRGRLAGAGRGADLGVVGGLGARRGCSTRCGPGRARCTCGCPCCSAAFARAGGGDGAGRGDRLAGRCSRSRCSWPAR